MTEVLASNDPAHSPGDIVWGLLRWELYPTVRGAELTIVDPTLGPISHAISVRGMPGLTAWVGIIEIGRPRPGDTVLVSSATGAVGSIVGQLARQAGARVVGTGGSEDKAAHAVNHLGYDAALDEHCSDGVDVYSDNVGGDLLEAVLTRMNPAARIPVCGMISRHEASDPDIKNLIGMLHGDNLGKRLVRVAEESWRRRPDPQSLAGWHPSWTPAEDSARQSMTASSRAVTSGGGIPSVTTSRHGNRWAHSTTDTRLPWASNPLVRSTARALSRTNMTRSSPGVPSRSLSIRSATGIRRACSPSSRSMASKPSAAEARSAMEPLATATQPRCTS
ncbi:MAG: NADP-dependent oxidoreductase [Actinomycetia bacterium]|nr:NADP-dependent oxidoreductase [Actinomycetes bacterium]